MKSWYVCCNSPMSCNGLLTSCYLKIIRIFSSSSLTIFSSTGPLEIVNEAESCQYSEFQVLKQYQCWLNK